MCYNDHPSPSRFKPSDDAPILEDELLAGSDNDSDDEIHPLEDESFSFHVTDHRDAAVADDSKHYVDSEQDLDPDKQSTMKIFDRSHLSFKHCAVTSEATQVKGLTKTLSASERIGMIRPEQQLDASVQRSLENPRPLNSVKSFRSYNSFKSEYKDLTGPGLISELRLDEFLRIRKKRSPFVRRSLWKHIQNLKLSTVGVGVMGYIGNTVRDQYLSACLYIKPYFALYVVTSPRGRRMGMTLEEMLMRRKFTGEHISVQFPKSACLKLFMIMKG